jgi:hypothetical protein
LEVKKELEEMLDICSEAAESRNWSVLCYGKSGKRCQIDTSIETFEEDWQIGAKAAPFIAALLSNSPVNWSYDTGAATLRIGNGNQSKSMPIHPIKSLSDWAEVLVDAPIINAKDYYAEHKVVPFWRYFLGRSDYESVWDAMVNIDSYWLDYCPTRFLTHELRSLDTPSQELLVLPEAIILGLSAQRQEFFKEFADMPWSDINYYRKRAELSGIGHHEVDPIRVRTKQMLEIAKRGLVGRGQGEEVILEEAFKILESGKNSSDRILKIYNEANAKGEDWRSAIVENTRWKLPAQRG